MKIAYVSIQDSTSIHSFSGTGYYIPQSLMMNGAEIHYVGQLKKRPYLSEKFKELFFNKIHHKTYYYNRNPKVIHNYGKQADKALAKVDHDAILSFSGPSIALLKTKKPMVLWADAVFADIINFYPEFTNLAKVTIRNGHKMERILLNRCTHIVYSSDWAAEGAKRHYGIPPEKISVIPYGANIETNWDRATIEKTLAKKDSNVCKLLFVGVNWLRKGGSQALHVAEKLNSDGLPTELHIIGCKPPDNKELPSYVKVHGFISKKTPEGKQLINNLISNAHFLILPTIADCTPIVFAEFNSYGIPCLTTNVGGIPTLIRDGINGKLFETDSKPSEYSNYIQLLFKNYSNYLSLAKTAYEEYRNRLNWQTSGKKMVTLLNKIID
jgi:glycosyltransferase involved in cell wall biosynthesis